MNTSIALSYIFLYVSCHDVHLLIYDVSGWVSSIHTGLIAPNFTEYGWGITRCPQGLLDELVSSLHGKCISYLLEYSFSMK